MTPLTMVTGGNRGIGYALTEGLLKLGHKVLLVARSEEEGERAIETLNGDVHLIVMDLTNLSQMEDALIRAQSVFGDIDILINNAGVLPDSGIDEVSVQDWRQAFDVNVKAPAWLIQQLLPPMLKNGFGRIINVSSGWGTFNENLEGPVAYAVTKAALNALTVKTANSIPAGKNVKVNAFCPGWVHTRMGGASAPLSPEEGADTGLWLASLGEDSPNGMIFRKRKPIKW